MEFTRKEVETIRTCVTTIFLDYLANGEDGDPLIERRRQIMGNVLCKVEEALGGSIDEN